MEEFFQTVGVVGMVLLVLAGLLAGWIASKVTGGRNTGRNLVIGVVGALAVPIVLAGLGVGVLVAGGLAAIVGAALLGAVCVLVVSSLFFD